MNKEQLQEWLLTHDQPDEWWIAIDGETKGQPVRLQDALQLKGYDPAREIHLLHSSRASSGAWIDLEARPQSPTVTQAMPPVAREPDPPSEAKRKLKPEQSTAGIFFFVLGLVLCIFLFPVGLIIGLPLMLGIFVTKKKYICTGCGNEILNTSEVCPACGSQITGVQMRVIDIIFWTIVVVVSLAIFWPLFSQ